MAGQTKRLLVFKYAWRDLKASVTVFFIALPLCLGIALATGVPAYSGFIAGIAGGLVVSLISRSPLSVSGPAAGLSAISVAAIAYLGDLSLFFSAVLVAGVLQLAIGWLRLGGFTWLIPSSVIKGMLAAIGILVISKQVPMLLGYDLPDFWSNELVNLIRLSHGFVHIDNLVGHISAGAVVITTLSFAVLVFWHRKVSIRWPFIPASFVTVLSAIVLSELFSRILPGLALKPDHFVNMPLNWHFQFTCPLSMRSLRIRRCGGTGSCFVSWRPSNRF